MKIIGLNGSPKTDGNTYLTIQAFFEEVSKEGFETEILHVGDGQIPGCVACRGCVSTGECAVPNELFKQYSDKILEADGLFLAAPVYFGTLPGQMKSFLDRFFFQCLQTGRMRQKVGAAAAILRRSGGFTTIDDLNRFFLAGNMVTVGHSIIHGTAPGEVLQDWEGLAAIRRIARNMAWILKMKDVTKDTVELPLQEQRQFMNFIR